MEQSYNIPSISRGIAIFSNLFLLIITGIYFGYIFQYKTNIIATSIAIAATLGLMTIFYLIDMIHRNAALVSLSLSVIIQIMIVLLIYQFIVYSDIIDLMIISLYVVEIILAVFVINAKIYDDKIV